MPSHTQSRKEIEGRLSDLVRLTPSPGGAVQAMPPLGAVGAAFDLLPDPVFCIDRRSMTFAEVNQAACSCLGYTAEELRRMGPYHVCPREDVAALAAELDALAAEGPSTVVVHTRQQRKDGRVVPVEWHAARIRDSAKEYWIVVARELAADGAAGQLAGETTAEWRGLGIPGHDPLTGLPDRRLFERRLDRALQRSRDRNDYRFAVCFVDLDNFKTVNDSLGHLIGDRVLCEVARRLSICVRPGDMVARFAGDEFTVLVDDLHDAAEAMPVARRILGQMEAPVMVEGRSVQVAASIGIAAGSKDYARIEDLLGDADRAMYRVKASGGNDCLLAAEPPAPGSIKPR